MAYGVFLTASVIVSTAANERTARPLSTFPVRDVGRVFYHTRQSCMSMFTVAQNCHHLSKERAPSMTFLNLVAMFLILCLPTSANNRMYSSSWLLAPSPRSKIRDMATLPIILTTWFLQIHEWCLRWIYLFSSFFSNNLDPQSMTIICNLEVQYASDHNDILLNTFFSKISSTSFLLSPHYALHRA